MPQRPLEARDAVGGVAPATRARRAADGLRASVRFRAATTDDAPGLVALINDAYLREAWLLPPPRITVEEMLHELQDTGRRAVIADIDGALAGSVRLSRHDGHLYFGLLAVASACQGRGLASLLVAEAERLARECGEAVLRLDCAKELGLPPFYESLGYAVESETPNSYFGHKGPFTLVVMRKALT